MPLLLLLLLLLAARHSYRAAVGAGEGRRLARLRRGPPARFATKERFPEADDVIATLTTQAVEQGMER